MVIVAHSLEVLPHLLLLVEVERQLHRLVRRSLHQYAFFVDDVARKHPSDYDLNSTWLVPRGGRR